MQPLLFLAEAALNPLEHVVQHPILRPEINGRPVMVLSNHIMIQILAALILLLVLPPMFRWARIGKSEDPSELVPRGSRNFIEATCEFFRTNLARPQLGEDTDRLMPFIWTVFFFILTCNLLGLIPLESITKPILGRYAFGGTPTGNIWINGTLAFFALVAVLYNGFRVQGLGYLKHFVPGPIWLAPLMVLVEVVGLIAKIVALAIRLFANMLAGHLLLAALLGMLSLAFVGIGTLGGFVIAVPIIVSSVAINLLELFVAFLQAFIFTFLVIVFISQAITHEEHHEEHPGESEAHEARPA